MPDFLIPLSVTVENESDLDDLYSEIEKGLQDGVDSGLLSKEISWRFGAAMPAGPYKTLVEKAQHAHSVKLADGTLWRITAQVYSTELVGLTSGPSQHFVKEADLAGATFYRLTEF